MLMEVETEARSSAYLIVGRRCMHAGLNEFCCGIVNYVNCAAEACH